MRHIITFVIALVIGMFVGAKFAEKIRAQKVYVETDSMIDKITTRLKKEEVQQ